MKVVLVIPLVLLAAATAFAYGHGGVAVNVTTVAAGVRAEPALLLVSGSALLGLASVVRRYTV
jgi:hypothetical protein